MSGTWTIIDCPECGGNLTKWDGCWVRRWPRPEEEIGKVEGQKFPSDHDPDHTPDPLPTVVMCDDCGERWNSISDVTGSDE